MSEYAVIECEREEFDKLKNEWMISRQWRFLKPLPEGWFPYRLPERGGKVTGADLTSCEIFCAVWRAIDALKEREENATD